MMTSGSRLAGIVLLACWLQAPARASAPDPSALPHPKTAAPSLAGPMVSIPGGVFRMGDTTGVGQDKEKPVHEVAIKPFRMAKFDVTVGQFRQFVTATGYLTEAETDVAAKGCMTMNIETNTWVRAGRTWDDPGYKQTDRHPVSCVSWNDAQAYIAWLNRKTHGRFRLPSEAEWEYAARGGGASTYFWGADANQACDYANGADQTPWPNGKSWKAKVECSDGYFFASPVGSFKPNPFGLYDMAGNVWQWTQDCWRPSYDGAPADGRAWVSDSCPERSTRGGSWHSAPGLRVSGREFGDPTRTEYGNQGFRLAEDR